MKIFIPFLSLLILAACSEKPAEIEKIKLATHLDSVGYAVGLDIANRLDGQFDDINPETIIQGIRDYSGSDSLRITEEERLEVIRVYTQVTQVEKQKALIELNKKAGEAFLGENLKDPKVKATESGLQYTVISEGGGVKPHFRDEVKVHYSGKLLDGTVFDSSLKRGEPTVFPLANVIPGFSEGLLLMTQGSKYKLFIPGDLAYGVKSGPGGPFSLLIFEVELIEVIKPPRME